MTSETVIALASHPKIFPIGAIARHREHGVVDIIARTGAQRFVRWFEHIPLPLSDDVPEVLFEEEIIEHEAWVDVTELRPMSPHQDVGRDMIKTVLDEARENAWRITSGELRLVDWRPEQ